MCGPHEIMSCGPLSSVQAASKEAGAWRAKVSRPTDIPEDGRARRPRRAVIAELTNMRLHCTLIY